jgi:TusA-related sulfurtransferase
MNEGARTEGGAQDAAKDALKDRYDREVDARGLSCPLPILRAKKALAEMQSGEVLKISCTDPGTIRDFQAFARQTGNTLVSQATAEASVGKEFHHYLRRR